MKYLEDYIKEGAMIHMTFSNGRKSTERSKRFKTEAEYEKFIDQMSLNNWKNVGVYPEGFKF